MKAVVEVHEPTSAELHERVANLAREHVGPRASEAEAFQRLDRGEFRGSVLESELKMLRFLLGSDAAPPLAAE